MFPQKGYIVPGHEGVWSYEQLKGNGWTDAEISALGNGNAGVQDGMPGDLAYKINQDQQQVNNQQSQGAAGQRAEDRSHAPGTREDNPLGAGNPNAVFQDHFQESVLNTGQQSGNAPIQRDTDVQERTPGVIGNTPTKQNPFDDQFKTVVLGGDVKTDVSTETNEWINTAQKEIAKTDTSNGYVQYHVPEDSKTPWGGTIQSPLAHLNELNKRDFIDKTRAKYASFGFDVNGNKISPTPEATPNILFGDGMKYLKDADPNFYDHIQHLVDPFNTGKPNYEAVNQFDRYKVYQAGLNVNQKKLSDEAGFMQGLYNKRQKEIAAFATQYQQELDQLKASNNINAYNKKLGDWNALVNGNSPLLTNEYADQFNQTNNDINSLYKWDKSFVESDLPQVKESQDEQQAADSDYANASTGGKIFQDAWYSTLPTLSHMTLGVTRFIPNMLAGLGFGDADKLQNKQTEYNDKMMKIPTQLQGGLFNEDGSFNYHRAFMLMPQIGIQMYGMFKGGTALEGTGLSTVPAQEISMFVQTQDMYQQDAINNGYTMKEAVAYGMMMAGVETLTERINPEEKIFGALPVFPNKELGSTTRELFKNTFKLKGLTAAEKSLQFTKGVVKTLLPEVAEEEAAQVGQYVTQSLLNMGDPNGKYNPKDNLSADQIGQTALSTMIGMLPIAAIGGVKEMTWTKNAVLYQAGKMPSTYLGHISQMAQQGKITPAQFKQMTDAVNTMRTIVPAIPNVDKNGEKLNYEDKVMLAANVYYNEQALSKKKTAPESLKSTVDADINETQGKIDNILSGKAKSSDNLAGLETELSAGKNKKNGPSDKPDTNTGGTTAAVTGTNNSTDTNTEHKGDKPKLTSTDSATAKKQEGVELSNDVVYTPLTSVNTDEKRFQPRGTEFSEESKNKVVNKFDDNKLDPVVLFNDPKDNKDYVLAGHSRLAGHKELENLPADDPRRIAAEENGWKPGKIKARYFKGNEAAAIDFADRSNDLGTKNKPWESANSLRKMRKNGATKKAIAERAREDFGDNASMIIDLSYLNPQGKTIDALDRLGHLSDKSQRNLLEGIAQKIGRVRKNYGDSVITDAHENELFDFMLNGGKKGKELATGAIREFEEWIAPIIGRPDFGPTKSLELNKLGNERDEEKEMRNEITQLQKSVKEKEGVITQWEDRLTKTKDREQVDLIKEKISKLHTEVNALKDKVKSIESDIAKGKTHLTAQKGLFDDDAELTPEEEKGIEELGVSKPEIKNFEDEKRDQDNADSNVGIPQDVPKGENDGKSSESKDTPSKGVDKKPQEKVTPIAINGELIIDEDGNITNVLYDKFEQLKKANDLSGLNELYSSVKIILNGTAQSRGEKIVKQFEKLKDDIEEYANKIKEKLSKEARDLDDNAESTKLTGSEKDGSILEKQYNKIKEKYPDAIVLFRVGDFYETLREDAVNLSKVIGSVLTKRGNGTNDIEMSGFPADQIDVNLPKLVRAGHRVAIVDALEDNAHKVKRASSAALTQGRGAVLPDVVTPDSDTKKAVDEIQDLFKNGIQPKQETPKKELPKEFDEFESLFDEPTSEYTGEDGTPQKINAKNIDGQPAHEFQHSMELKYPNVKNIIGETLLAIHQRPILADQLKKAYGSVEQYISGQSEQERRIRESTSPKLQGKIYTGGLLSTDRTGSKIRGNTIEAGSAETKLRELDYGKYTIRNAQDVADIDTLFRSPWREAFTAILVKDGKIVWHLTSSIGITYNTNGIKPDVVIGKAKEIGADTVYISHNHPSGNPTESPEDLQLTKDFVGKINTDSNLTFGGHVIVDHDKYTLINENNEVSQHGFKVEKQKFHYRELRITPQNAAVIGSQLLTQHNFDAALVLIDSPGRFAGYVQIPDGLTAKEFNQFMKLHLLDKGSRYMVIVHNGSFDLKAVAPSGILPSNVWDVIDTSNPVKRYANEGGLKGNDIFNSDSDRADIVSEEQAKYDAEKEAKILETGLRMVKSATDNGIYKFKEIVKSFEEKGITREKLIKMIPYLQRAYTSFLGDPMATDQAIAMMDTPQDVRKFVLDSIHPSINDKANGQQPATGAVRQDSVRPSEKQPTGNIQENGERKQSNPILQPKTGELFGQSEDIPTKRTSSTGGKRGSVDNTDIIGPENKKLDEELGGESDPVQTKPGDSIVTPDRHAGNFVIPSDFTNKKTFNKEESIKNNIEAIKLIIKLRDENRLATKGEQNILFKYVGWGGLKEIGLNPKGTNWADSNKHLIPYVNEAIKLIHQLDESGELFEAIKESTLNAFYTPIPVIRGIYDVLKAAGFDKGAVLEPSMGTGHFFGAMPFEMMKDSRLSGIELDPITAEISKHLYPSTSVKNMGFEKAGVQPNSADLVISNIPFGDSYSIYDPSWKGKKKPMYRVGQQSVHGYFFIKAIESVRPGGLIAFVTSTGVLDSASNKAIREGIASTCEFMGAIRLPNTSFKGNAGTEVTSDIIFLRKLGPSEKQTGHAFVNTKYKDLTHPSGRIDSIDFNEYFHDHPEMMLGNPISKSMYADAKGFTLTSDERAEDLQKSISDLSKKIFPKKVFSSVKNVVEIVDAELEAYDKIINHEQSGSLVLHNGKPGIIEDGYHIDEKLDAKAREIGLNPDNIREGDIYPDQVEALKKAGVQYKDFLRANVRPVDLGASNEKLPAYIKIRDGFIGLIKNEISGASDEVLMKQREQLMKDYQAFVSKFGRLNERKNTPLINNDIDGFSVSGLEIYERNKDGKNEFARLSDIFTKRTLRQTVSKNTADDINDAISISLDQKGKIDVDLIKSLLGGIDDNTLFDLWKGAVYENPEGGFETSDDYLSGNVRAKLRIAEQAAAENPRFTENVDALKKVLPVDIPPSQIHINMGATWIPIKYYQQFAREVLGSSSVSVIHTGFPVYTVSKSSSQANASFGTDKKRASDIFENLMNNKPIIVTEQIPDENSPGGKKTIINESATAAAQSKAELMRRVLKEWFISDANRGDEIAKIFNELINNEVTIKKNGQHMTLPGINQSVQIDPWKKDTVHWAVKNQGGLIDHEVGLGKTFIMAMMTMEMRRLGIAKKPILLCLKANVSAVVHEFKNIYPGAKILYPSENDFTAKNRKKLFAKMATNDYDAIIMTHENYKAIPQDDEIQKEMLDEQIAQLEAAVNALAAEDKTLNKNQITKLEERIKNIKAKFQKLTDFPRDKSVLSFQDIGIDHMMVDESHFFKNLPFATAIQKVAGMGNPAGSQRAMNLLFGIRSIQKMKQGDKGVTFLTGTPITNSIAEAYLIMEYLIPNKLKSMNINSFDEFTKVFAEQSKEVEFGVTNSLVQKERFRYFGNVPELAKLYRSFSDVKFAKEVGIDRPDISQTHLLNTSVEIPIGTPVTINGKEYIVSGNSQGEDEDGEEERNNVNLFSKSGIDIPPMSGGKIILPSGEEVPYKDGFSSDGTYVSVKSTPLQLEFAQALSEWMEINSYKPGSRSSTALTNKWKLKRYSKKDKARNSVALQVTTKAAKAAIDMRLIDKNLPINEKGKIATMANDMVKIWKETEGSKGLQLMFSDLGTPKSKITVVNLRNYYENNSLMDPDTLTEIFGEEGVIRPLKDVIAKIEAEGDFDREEIESHIEEANTEEIFDVYNALKDELVKRGVPEEQIQFIHNHDTQNKRQILFDRATKGDVRFLFGSTSKLGTGVNVQEKIVAIHHLDVPWGFHNIDQRNGRGVRRGAVLAKSEMNNVLPVKYYITEGSLDRFKLQTVGIKKYFSHQFRSGQVTDRYIDEGEIDNNGSGAGMLTMAAALSGNRLLDKKQKLTSKVKKLDGIKRDTISFKNGLIEKAARAEREAASMKMLSGKQAEDYADVEKHIQKDGDGNIIYQVKVGDQTADKAKDAGRLLIEERLRSQGSFEDKKIGEVLGMDILMDRTPSVLEPGKINYAFKLQGKSGLKYQINVSDDQIGQGTSIFQYPQKLGDASKRNIDNSKEEERRAADWKEGAAKISWDRQEELDKAIEELNKVSAKLSEQADKNKMYLNKDKEEDASETEETPSVEEPKSSYEIGMTGGRKVIVKPLPEGTEVVNGFYSPMQKAILDVKDNKLTGAKWLSQLQSKGVKADELQFTGTKDFLEKNRDKTISKADLHDYWENNKIQVVEVVKDDRKGLTRKETIEFNKLDKEIDVLEKEKTRLARESYDKNVTPDRQPEYQEVTSKIKVLMIDWERLRDKAQDKSKDTKFSQYQLEGDKSGYKEVLITMPSVEKKSAEVVMVGERPTDGYNVIVNGKVINKEPFASRSKANDYVDTIDKNKGKTDFKSTHFDEPNILAHLRMNVRTDAEGKKTLFIEEVQSDWGQEGKKDGFSRRNADIGFDYYWRGDRVLHGNRFGILNEYEMVANDVLDDIHTLIDDYGYFEKSNKWNLNKLSEIDGYKWNNWNEVASDLIKRNYTRSKTQARSYDEREERHIGNEISMDAVAMSKDILEFIDFDKAVSNLNISEMSVGDAVKMGVKMKLSPTLRRVELNSLSKQDNVSLAPFVTDTNAWVKLALKTALKEAVLNHSQKLAWTTGEQQNERYDLSKQVNKIEVEAPEEVSDVHFVDIHLANYGDTENLEVENGVIRIGAYKGQRLENVIGKEYAEKVLSVPQGETKTLEGEDLKIGGKGMIGFYGSPKEGKLGIVGQVAESMFGKGSVKTTEIETGEHQDKQKTFDTREQARDFAKKANVRSVKAPTIYADNDTNTFTVDYQEPKPSTQHSIDITPEMRSEVEKGLPLFEKGSKYLSNFTLQKTDDGISYFSESTDDTYPTGDNVQRSSDANTNNYHSVIGVWNKTKNLQFTGSTKVKSHKDVAHIMRLLEDKSVEHGFAVHIDKKGNSHIQFLSIGGTTGTVIEPKNVLAGAKKFNAVHTVLVHNHPSGNLSPSQMDLEITKKIRTAYDMEGITLDHVIMDTFSKQYIHIDDWNNWTVQDRDLNITANKKLSVHVFDEQKVLGVMPFEKIRNAGDTADFIQQLRFTAMPKNAVLLLNQGNLIIGNYVFQDDIDWKQLTSFITDSGIGNQVIFYGNQDNIKTVNALVPKLKSIDVRVLDSVITGSDGNSIKQYYKSMANEGLLAETQVQYGTNLPNTPSSTAHANAMELVKKKQEELDRAKNALDNKKKELSKTISKAQGDMFGAPEPKLFDLNPDTGMIDRTIEPFKQKVHRLTDELNRLRDQSDKLKSSKDNLLFEKGQSYENIVKEPGVPPDFSIAEYDKMIKDIYAKRKAGIPIRQAVKEVVNDKFVSMGSPYNFDFKGTLLSLSALLDEEEQSARKEAKDNYIPNQQAIIHAQFLGMPQHQSVHITPPSAPNTVAGNPTNPWYAAQSAINNVQNIVWAQPNAAVSKNVANLATKLMVSKNYLVRNLAGLMNSFTRWAYPKELADMVDHMKGSYSIATHDSVRMDDALRQIVGYGKHGEYQRMHQVMDPDFYIKQGKTPVDYTMLTSEEKKVVDILKGISEIVHSINFVNGFIDYDTYLKFKDKYIARMYDVYEQNGVEAEAGREAFLKMMKGMYEMRDEEIDKFKAAHIIADPIYLVMSRQYQTIINKAVADYASYIASAYPHMVMLKSEWPTDNRLHFKGFTKLGSGYGVLSNQYVSDQVAEDFRGFFYSNAIANSFYKAFKIYDKTWLRKFYRQALTVFNAPVQITNIAGNHVLSAMIGVNPYDLDRLIFNGTVKNEIANDGPAYRLLLQSNVLKNNLSRTDLLAMADSPLDYRKQSSTTKLGKAMDAVHSFYGGVDDYYKLSAYLNLLNRGLSERDALEQVRNGFQNASRVGKMFDLVSRVPFIGNMFARWAGDLQRIIRHGLATRPLQLGLFLSVLNTLGAIFQYMSGEDDKDKKLREGRPGAAKIPLPDLTDTFGDWIKYVPVLNFVGGDISLQFKGAPTIKNGNLGWDGAEELNVARLLSPIYLYNNFDGNDIGGSIQKFLLPINLDTPDYTSNPNGKLGVMLARLNQDPVTQVFNLAFNSDFTGTPIFDPAETKYKQSTLTDGDRLKNGMSYLLRQYLPYGANGQDFINAIKGDKDYYGRNRTPGQVIGSTFFGIKLQQMPDPKYGIFLYNKINSKSSQFKGLGQKLNSITNDVTNGVYDNNEGMRRAAPVVEEMAELMSEIQQIVDENTRALSHEQIKEVNSDLKLSEKAYHTYNIVKNH